MSEQSVVVHQSAEILAAATAARLITTLTDLQATRHVVAIGLTGGRTGIEVLNQVNKSPARDAVDWSAVEIYWGDERFLPAGDPERNETQARTVLLDHVPVPESRIHAIPPSDGDFGDDPDAAAKAYAELMTGVALDVLLVGVGEEGHTLSVFPDSPAVREGRATVIAVRDCPKPPPTRVSLTLPAARRASQVWLVTAGESKAEAVTAALSDASETDIPAAGATGRDITLWLVDRAAAGR
ncbi:6-phosphogluconolactonase [Actinokineospora auranticolor]|uniref:6-phosphogluconolactonase n=1 Tax=Actinokineospora auranticolor TaxID=155976 RepID=A0A2S6GNF6_9PSEU|nr:6-phosphogluconolactonase [Actinokineospora auranticolor]PPK66747.1 6-phosphogluconolactonase [Actinokineospora auranticolor]